MRTSAHRCAAAFAATRRSRLLLAAPILAAVCATVLAAAGTAAAAAPNGYTQETDTYATAGCFTWAYPPELAGSVSMTAVGAAGTVAGDEVSGTLTGLESPTQSLYVCVDGAGGQSSVSYGTDSTEPFIIAAGGGSSSAPDFCSSPYGAYGISVILSGCTVTAGAGTASSAGTTPGDAEVTLSYLDFTGFTSSTSSAPYSVATGEPWAGTGNAAYDTASVGGTYRGYSPAGTLTYTLFANGTCTTAKGAVLSTQTVTLNQDGSVPNSSSSGPLAPGTYSYLANYNGDSDFVSSSDCESFTVSAATKLTAWPQIALRIGIGEWVVGATLTSGGAPVAGQTISFNLGPLKLCSAVTNASGYAHCYLTPLQEVAVLIANHYSASFASAGGYVGSSSSTPVIELFAL